MNDEDNVSATELSEEIAKFMSQADRHNGYGTIAENLMSDNWEFICSRLVLSDVLEHAPVGLSPRLEIASRVLAALNVDNRDDAAWDGYGSDAEHALRAADALLAADRENPQTGPNRLKGTTTAPEFTITREQARDLAAWAEENHPNGTTAWGPKFSAAMRVADAVRVELDDREGLTDRVAFGPPCNHEECAGHGACLRQTK